MMQIGLRLELIKALKKNNLNIAAHITLVNKSIDDLEKIVSDFAKLGVKKFVALRGDSPEGKFKQHPNGFFNKMKRGGGVNIWPEMVSK